MDDSVLGATLGGVGGMDSGPENSRVPETGQAKNQSLLLSLSLGLRPVSQLPVKLFTAGPTGLNFAPQPHRRGTPWEAFGTSPSLTLSLGESILTQGPA